jgi:hypothetical protein
MTTPIHAQPPAERFANRLRAVAQLPAPAPGRVISVPLLLWLEYLRIHNLEVVGKKGDAILTLSARNKDTRAGG